MFGSLEVWRLSGGGRTEDVVGERLEEETSLEIGHDSSFSFFQ